MMYLSLVKGVPTKRAPEAGDSAHIPISFLRLIIFLVGRLRRPHPGCRACRDTAQVPTGQAANCWAVPFVCSQRELFA